MGPAKVLLGRDVSIELKEHIPNRAERFNP
jgi:hypothetical protein